MRTLSLAPISGRRRPARDGIAPWLAPSLVVHVLLLAPNLLGPRPADGDRPVHEVLFLAPLLPKSEPHANTDDAAGPGGVRVGWTALSTLTPSADGVAIGTAMSETPGLERSVAQRDLTSPPVPEPDEAGDEHIYQAVDVDREVVREPDAASPIYPETLRLTGVQGGVTVEFVVDTSGRVEEGSMHVIGTTHALFAAAVREAAPAMHFRAAVRSGRTVRQQVIQSFQFVIQAPAAAAAAAANAKARPDSVP